LSNLISSIVRQRKGCNCPVKRGNISHFFDWARSEVATPAILSDAARVAAIRAGRLPGRLAGDAMTHAVRAPPCVPSGMRYLALATDYDGTLAENGRVRQRTKDALVRLRKSGRRAVLVTGRELGDLQSVFDGLALFDRVVAENGALLYDPATRKETVLAEPPPPELARRLAARGAHPLGVGRVIVSTREPHHVAALEIVHELDLEWQLIFNKGAVMLLPSGVNKQTGLQRALDELGLSMRNTVAAGDAENDHAMLAAAECGVAVANALDALKDRADLVVRGSRGSGVEELIDRMLADDLRSVVVARHALLLGTRRDGTELRIAPAGRRLLIAGPAGSGKIAAATGFIERLMAAGYQCCIVDPEGGYEGFDGLVCLGTAGSPPTVDEVLELLERPSVHAGVSLLGVPPGDRPAFFASLMPRLQEMRGRTGRPHWIVIDQAHHLLPASWQPAPLTLPRELGGVLLVTLHPERISPAVLEAVDTALAVGDAPEATLRAFGPVPPIPLEQGEALALSNRLIEPLRLVPDDKQRRGPVRETIPRYTLPQ
jgi:hydroxymethylpyrimidine pyrophosphatase-like HAD family hydrolase